MPRACDGHPLAPVAGPIAVKGAEPGDAVLIDILDMQLHEDGMRRQGVVRMCAPRILTAFRSQSARP